MSAAKKGRATPVPDMGGLTDDWQRLAQMRQGEHGQEETPAAPVEAKPAARAAPEMTRRSWYAEKGAVEALAAVVDDIHHATRVPKHEVVSELFRAAAAAAPKVQKKMSK